MPLTHKQVQNAKPGRHSDGGGLYLLVKPSGARSWVLRVQHEGRRRDFGIGSFTDKSAELELPIHRRKLLTLTEARDKAKEGRKLAKAGVAPSAAWREMALAEREQSRSFEEVAREYHANVAKSWRNGKHGSQWINTLETYAFPVLGQMRVEDIDAASIQQVLMPIWLSKGETARRVKQRIGVVLDYARGKGWRSSDAPMRAVGQLMGGIKQPKGSHFASMPYADVPAFMAKLQAADFAVGRLALQFLILTAARSGEVRGATWSEVDLDNAEWRIPPARMKAGKLHIVPLVPAAVAILEEMRGLFAPKPKDLVFPGLKGPMSDATMAKALRTNGGAGFTVHGFRSAFRDWAADTGFADAWAEAALAHGNPDKTEAAYRRTNYFTQRKDKLMPAWASFALGDGSNVVQLASVRA